MSPSRLDELGTARFIAELMQVANYAAGRLGIPCGALVKEALGELYEVHCMRLGALAPLVRSILNPEAAPVPAEEEIQ